MKETLKQVLDKIDYDDLLKLKFDLDNGSVHIKHLVDKKIKEIEAKNKHICANCGKTINPLTDYEITVTYGTPDFKKRAHLCSVDCLIDFTKELKKIELSKNRRN